MKVTHASWIFISYFSSTLLANRPSTANLGSRIKAIEYVRDVNSQTGDISILPSATLQEAPKESFPPIFTICSAISSPAYHYDPTSFFKLRGEDDEFYFSIRRSMMVLENSLTTHFVPLFHQKAEQDGFIPVVFPTQWSKGCTSVDSFIGRFYKNMQYLILILF